MRKNNNNSMAYQQSKCKFLYFIIVLICLLFTIVTCAVDEDTNANEVTPPKDHRELICPDPQTRDLPYFTLGCKRDADCEILGEQCCKEDGIYRCRKGVPKPKPEPKHAPFLGIPRECPTVPVMESFAVRNCTNDADCWPRLCCPDGVNSYCRTSSPKWEMVPRLSPLKNVIAYLQCTPPPPLIFDLFPKACRTTVDCFPNLCCQEKNKKVCRPPKKSILALIASVTRV